MAVGASGWWSVWRAALKEGLAPDTAVRMAAEAVADDSHFITGIVIVIDPATHPLSEVAFGLAVTVADDHGHTTTYEITGEDEADATLCRIAPQSPLARALIGAQLGDVVLWRKPSGPISLEIIGIAHADQTA